MSTLPRFSLDTPNPGDAEAHSGHNFREVCPEVLSPLSWSLVGAGMERGYRHLAAASGKPETSFLPRFVSYFGFRPYVNMTSVERVADRFPGVSGEDVWLFLLGGPRPLGAGHEAAAERVRAWRRARAATRVLTDIGAELRQVSSATFALERRVEAVLGEAAGAGAAVDTAVEVARRAWALHIRTTGACVGTGAVLRRAFGRWFRGENALELMRMCASRATVGSQTHAGGVTVEEATSRLNTYEVADQAPDFEPFSLSYDEADLALLAAVAGGDGARGGTAVRAGVPTGASASVVVEPLVQAFGVALAERERSKELGLRALHCVRLLVDSGGLGMEPADAAFLGFEEHRLLPRAERAALVAARREELAEARDVAYPVELIVQGQEARPLGRPPAGDGVSVGVPLSPGWAEGVVATSLDAVDPATPAILMGQRVDVNYLVASAPEAVILEYGSILSHVSIVCRELGIPCVGGIRVGTPIVGKRAAVDGWSGVVTVQSGSER